MPPRAVPVCVVLLAVAGMTATSPGPRGATALSPHTLPCTSKELKEQVSGQSTSSPEPGRTEARTSPCPTDSHAGSNTRGGAGHSAVHEEEAELKDRLTGILNDLGFGVGPAGQDLARSGVFVQVLEKVRSEGLADQLMRRRGPGQAEGGGDGREENAVMDADDPLGKDAAGVRRGCGEADTCAGVGAAFCSALTLYCIPSLNLFIYIDISTGNSRK